MAGRILNRRELREQADRAARQEAAGRNPVVALTCSPGRDARTGAKGKEAAPKGSKVLRTRSEGRPHPA
jgi:hypothetical protein